MDVFELLLLLLLLWWRLLIDGIVCLCLSIVLIIVNGCDNWFISCCSDCVAVSARNDGWGWELNRWGWSQ